LLELTEARRLEQLRYSEASEIITKDFEQRAADVDRSSDRRSGAWHAARGKLKFDRIEAVVNEALRIRKEIISQCPELGSADELRRLEERLFRTINVQFQQTLNSFQVEGVRPLASVITASHDQRRALKDRVLRSIQILVLEAADARHDTALEASRGIEPIRIYPEEIDSFSGVGKIGPAAVAQFLTDGYLDQSEDEVQHAFEAIIGVPFHKKDRGGEMSDLYTGDLRYQGQRAAAAFLLKGHGLRQRTMTIADCGRNGDQLVRLFDSPAKLFVVQFIGKIAENLIRDVEGKTRHLQLQGKKARFCILEGNDVTDLLKSSSITPKRTSFRSPWQNGVAERWIGSCRRELLDHVIVINESHLRRLLQDYVSYYHADRTHDALDKDVPEVRLVSAKPSGSARAVSFRRVGGLHHRYDCEEAA
jgi:hypothetical protein